MKTLPLLIVFSIFILTKQFEVKTRDVENFGLDVGGGLPIRGMTDLSSYGQFLISREISRLDQKPRSSQDDCGNFSAWVIRNKQSSLSFWRHIDDDPSEEGLQTSAETRQTCRQNLTSDNDKLNNREFKSNDSPFNSRSPQRPDDPVQLQILMLEDDEVVRTSAASLYAKHPAVSSVHVVDPQQRVHQVKGQPVVLSEHSSLVLVGHGARDRSGEMRISGYTSKDVARIIQNSSRISQKIQTTTVVACEAGSDQRFREALLKELHEAGIETELHLWTAVVQVTESGEVISQDVSADGAQWRSGDDTKKVVLTVGSNGEIRRRKETDHRGREVLTNQTRLLGDPKTDQNHPEGKSWPERPTLFIDPEIYKMIDQNKIAEITEDIKMLEAFTWGLFHPEPGATAGATAAAEPGADIPQCPNEKDNYFIGDLIAEEHKKNTKEQNIDKVLKSCFKISSGKDIKNVIRHYGKDEKYGKNGKDEKDGKKGKDKKDGKKGKDEKDGKNGKDGKDKSTFLMVDNWIFEVGSVDLYVRPVGNYHGIIEDEDRQEKREMRDAGGGRAKPNLPLIAGLLIKS
ncbi:PREDICTED: uncharacterized protein LOC107084622 [Cyprinodon variegatus]|uniref:uncharacterized protein LOC107084622 n=1 Tax=Cyprinodon variegatus TaxID=28743 RepID=UPI0007425C43|nr:PREDICTED: uncharacterized protein LOC107084622 [Cyprinodon variegatus]